MKPLAPRLHAAPRWLFWLLLLSGALLLGLCTGCTGMGGGSAVRACHSDGGT